MNTQSDRVSVSVAVVLTSVFSAYAVALAWRHSFIAIDGKRYFSVADDALVALRYGWNLAHGHGLVWNPDQRVEGITSLAWALHAAVLSLFLDRRLLPFGVQIIAILLLSVTALSLRTIFRRVTDSNGTSARHLPLEMLAVLIPLSSIPLVNWSVSGTETSLLSALLAMAIARLVRAPPSRSGSALLGAAFLTRPDVLVPSTLILVLRLVRRLTAERSSSDRPLAELLPFVAIVAGAGVFRYVYYGALVPNAYVLSTSGLPVLERIQANGLPYIKPLLDNSTAIMTLVLLSVIARPTFDKLMLASVPASMLAYSVYIGGDAFPDWRFMAPYVPYAYLVVVIDCAFVSDRMAATSRGGRIGRVTARAIPAAALALFVVHAWRQPYRVAEGAQLDNIANINTAIYLTRTLGPDATVGVFYAGAIPYYTGLRAVDFLGKSDPYIARLRPDTSGAIAWQGMRSMPGHNKYDLRYSILEQRPTYVAGLKYGRQDVTREALELYERVPVNFATWSDFDDHAVLLRKGSKDVTRQ